MAASTLMFHYGGWGGIRTLETREGLPLFESGQFNHSCTQPYDHCTTDSRGIRCSGQVVKTLRIASYSL